MARTVLASQADRAASRNATCPGRLRQTCSLIGPRRAARQRALAPSDRSVSRSGQRVAAIRRRRSATTLVRNIHADDRIATRRSSVEAMWPPFVRTASPCCAKRCRDQASPTRFVHCALDEPWRAPWAPGPLTCTASPAPHETQEARPGLVRWVRAEEQRGVDLGVGVRVGRRSHDLRLCWRSARRACSTVRVVDDPGLFPPGGQ